MSDDVGQVNKGGVKPFCRFHLDRLQNTVFEQTRLNVLARIFLSKLTKSLKAIKRKKTPQPAMTKKIMVFCFSSIVVISLVAVVTIFSVGGTDAKGEEQDDLDYYMNDALDYFHVRGASIAFFDKVHMIELETIQGMISSHSYFFLF